MADVPVRVVKLAVSRGFDAAEYIGDIDASHVYIACFSSDEPCLSGAPTLIVESEQETSVVEYPKSLDVLSRIPDEDEE